MKNKKIERYQLATIKSARARLEMAGPTKTIEENG